MARLNPPADWDYVLVGDGSGSQWGKGAGWAAALVDRNFDVTLWNGGCNSGTVTVAELMAYVLPLNYLASEVAGANSQDRPAVRVHVFSDSDYAVKTSAVGNRYFHKNGCFWAFYDSLARSGVLVDWHWRKRDSSAFNVLADALSRESRLAVPAKLPPKSADWKELELRSDARTKRAREKKQKKRISE